MHEGMVHGSVIATVRFVIRLNYPLSDACLRKLWNMLLMTLHTTPPCCINRDENMKKKEDDKKKIHSSKRRRRRSD